jgi:hypothetical protein
MTAEEAVDRHLRAVFEGLVTAIYATKQLVWSAPASRRGQLQDLLAFLIDQSHVVDEAEARIGGRASGMAAPSSHERHNLLGEADNDVQAALAAYTDRVSDLASDIRRRAGDMGSADEAKLLVDIADELQRRVDLLVSS